MSHRPCYWHEDTDGSRFLVPGCLTRINNPDIDECTCSTINAQLEAAQQQIAELTKKVKGLQQWHDAVVAAVYAHTDGIKIMHAASQRVPS